MSGKPSTTRVVKYIRRGVGISYTEVEYADSTSNKTAPTNGWQTNAPAWKNGHFIWQRIKFVYSDGAYQYSSPVCLSGGKGISSITEYYLATSASSGVTTSTSGWTTSVQAITATKKYLWNYEVVSYTDGSTTTTTPIIIGAYGDKGISISSITEYYLATSASSGVTTSTSGWTTSVQAITAAKKYLWNYEVVSYTDGSTTTTTPVIIGAYGDKGKDGKDAVHLALDQVVGSVPCNLLLQTAPPNDILYTTLTLYQGGKEIDMPAPTITLTSPHTGVVLDSTPGKSRRYKITVYDSAGLAETVTFKVVYQGVEYRAVFTVNKLKPGDEGTGIASVNSYYAISTLPSGVTRSNTSGWVKGTFQQPTAEKPYAWKYTETTYTNGKEATYTDCELIFTYNAGVNPNLLEDTDFRDDAHMGAWDTKLGTSWVDGVTPESDYSIGIVEQGLQGRNCFRGGTLLTAEKINYRAILRQPIITKLRPSTWYTLSYWLRVSAESMFYDPVTSGKYGFNGYDLYLTAGHTYLFTIRGYISAEAKAAGKVLWANINGPDGKWDFQKIIDISSTSSVNKSIEFSDVPKTGRYTIMFYSYPNDGNTTPTVTIERAWIQDKTQQVGVYVHGGVVDTTVKGFVNGIEQTLGSEGDVYYGVTGIYRLYTYTFKTKAALPESAFVNFRLFPDCVASKESDGARAGISYADICMPKLEEGMMATGYVANEKSLMGDRGPMLRGPQAWSDCAVGYKFQAGGEGDEFKDVVLYNGNYYSCIKSHTKTASNYPGSTTDTNSGLWKLGDKVELVATKILLATYALVKNLGVEAIDMKDSSGNILFQAKDGNVICKTGTFENVTVSGVIKGVTGSFKSLDCVDADGNTVGRICASTSEYGGVGFESVDIVQNGTYDGRSLRFMASDIWCRGSFGAHKRNTVVVSGSYAYYYTKGLSKSGIYVSLTSATSSNNEIYYNLYCYSPSSNDASGFPVDTIIFNISGSTTYRYRLIMADSQRVMVINGNNSQSNVQIYSNGSKVQWDGGELAEVIQLPTAKINPTPSSSNLGAGLIVGAFRDNNWS